MKSDKINRKDKRIQRHKKVLRKYKKIDNGLFRLRVTKTNTHIFAQILDDSKNIVLTSSSSLQLKLKNGNIENSKKVGEDIAKKALKLEILKINFDCGGSKYHGRISALADAAREKGLKF